MVENNIEPYDVLIKLLLIGDTSVGKTNIVSRYIQDVFSEKAKPTLGVDFMTKMIEINEKKVRVQIWDTAGQEKYRSITRSYYSNAKGAIVVYDVTDKLSFKNVEGWINDLKSVVKELNIAIVGNKVDLVDDREVTKEEAEAYASSLGCVAFETSAKTGHNISALFKELIEAIFSKFYVEDSSSSEDERIKEMHTIHFNRQNTKNNDPVKKDCSC